MGAKEKRYLLLTIYIFSFIIMLFGVAFSYFTARTRSDNNAVATKSGKLTLTLEVVAKFPTGKLAPMNDTDVMQAFHNQCIDSNGRTACAAYEITVSNETAKQDVAGTVDFSINHIENLNYLVLDEQDNVYQNITKINKSTKNLSLGRNFILDSALESGIPTKRKFTLIIWLSNKNYNQLEDANGTYEASITYNSVYGQKLSSTISSTEKGGN